MRSTEIRRLTDVEDRHWWFREKRSILARELRRLGAPGRALDIGAAGGGNSRVLRDHGWRAVAADLNETAVTIARERGLDAVHADARDLPWEDGTFDLVTAFEVLEHIKEDDVAAAEIHRVLRPGGVALVTVPADMRLWSAHDEAVHHVRRYDRAGLTRVVAGSGLVVDRVWSWNVLLRPLIAAYRRRSTGSDIDDPPPALVNAALRGILVAERHLPLGSLPGVSLILRAHRPATGPPASPGPGL
ncbi:Methyltransferase domain-containing protein [Micromonospora nigra]|uniref:Methyltransferase domain-containing protein n=1 Tax=Micromonospora nigra TaxID=145857 RepID=A0A1C6SY63_9ACTN|nr:class I SAM-dependent methyltransferase [Micromonospora nigra]SCL34501.1 Methyltransferase domain-containing protein [Micromonospora nigra]